jgi:hypothetical protein
VLFWFAGHKENKNNGVKTTGSVLFAKKKKTLTNILLEALVE